jgi:DUF4097 and DUF4098 domain-containing protein YvlB
MDNRELLKVLERGIERLEEKKRKIKKEIEEQEIEEWRKRKNKGWIPFVLKTPSSYEDDDIVIVDYYAVTSSVASEFKDLSLAEVEKFIKKLKEGEDYYYFNNETIFQAVWPEEYITDDE